MKIDPLVIRLCEKAELINEKLAKELNEKEKVRLLLEANKYLRLAVFLQKSANLIILAELLDLSDKL